MDSTTISLLSLFSIVLIGVFEIVQNIYLIKEIKEIDEEYGNFMANVLDANDTNLRSNFPYKVIKNKYICIPFDDNLTIEEQLLEEEPDGFPNAHQIIEDLAYHSAKWRNTYLWSYWAIWSFQAIIVFTIIGMFLYSCGSCIINSNQNHKEIAFMFLILGYAATLTWKLHLFLLAAFLQSLFISLDFLGDCIFSPNPNNADIPYNLKNWGLTMFGVGFLLLFLYFGLLIIQAIGPLDYIRGENRYRAVCVKINILLEFIVMSELISRLAYFGKFVAEFPESENKLMLTLILLVLFARIFIVCGIYSTCTYYYCKYGTSRTITDNNTGRIISNVAGVDEVKVELGPGSSLMFCTICLDQLLPTTDVVKIHKCSHMFHRKCINEWATHTQSCPMCRGRI